MLLISNKFDKLVIRLASFNHSMRYKRQKKRKNVLFFFFLIVLRIVVPYKQQFIAQQRQKIIRGK